MGKSGKWELHPEDFNCDCINLVRVTTLPPIKPFKCVRERKTLSVIDCFVYFCELGYLSKIESFFKFLYFLFNGASIKQSQLLSFIVSMLCRCWQNLCLYFVCVRLCQCAYCVRALESLWDLWKGQWVIGTRQKGWCRWCFLLCVHHLSSS